MVCNRQKRVGKLSRKGGYQDGERSNRIQISLVQRERGFGITIDQACSDIGRKRFVSYDPEPYINYEAETYEELSDEKMQHHSPHTVNSDTTANWYEIAQTDFYINAIEKQKMDITHPFPKWFRIWCAFANAFSEDGREMFHRISRFYHNYDTAETDKLFDLMMV